MKSWSLGRCSNSLRGNFGHGNPYFLSSLLYKILNLLEVERISNLTIVRKLMTIVIINWGLHNVPPKFSHPVPLFCEIYILYVKFNGMYVKRKFPSH